MADDIADSARVQKENPWADEDFRACTVKILDPEIADEWSPSSAGTSSVSAGGGDGGKCLWTQDGDEIYYNGPIRVGTEKESVFHPMGLFSKEGAVGGDALFLELRNTCYNVAGMAGTTSTLYWTFSTPQDEVNACKVAGIRVGCGDSWSTNSFTMMSKVRTWGVPGTGAGQFSEPVDVCSDGTHIYVLEYTNNRISKWTEDDAYINSLGGTAPGSGDDEFNQPYGMCYFGGYLYVADQTNHRIKIHDASDLSYVDQFGTVGSGDDNFNGPVSVCTDGTYLYIADVGNYRIVKRLLASPYTYQAQVGAYGSGAGQFVVIFGVTTDKTYVYATDTYLGRISKFNCSDLSYVGATGTSFTAPGGICYFVGHLFIADNSRFHKLTTAMGTVQTTSDAAIVTPKGCCGHKNYIYLTKCGTGNDQIQVWAVLPYDPIYTIGAYVGFHLEISGSFKEVGRFTEDGDFVVGKTTATELIESAANIRADGYLVSGIADGTTPVYVTSETLCEHLNADMLDGYHASEIGLLGLTDPNADRIIFWDDSETALAWLACGNSIAITGTTLDTIQDIRTTASPTFAGATLATGDLAFTWVSSSTKGISCAYDANWYWKIQFAEATRVLTIQNQSNDTGGDIKLLPSTGTATGSVYIGTLAGLLKGTAGAVSAIAATTAADYLGGDLAFHSITGALGHDILSTFHTDTTPAAVVRGDIIIGSGASPKWTRLGVGASGTYLAGGTEPSWATLNQAAVAGLTAADSPVFVTVKCSGLTDGYLPYHVSDAAGLADGPIRVGPLEVLAATELTYIDATAAGDFVDAASTLAAYAGASGDTPYKIVVTDAAGKTATGYLGAAGAGETTSETLTDGGLENWTTPTNLTSWTESVLGTSTINQETVDVHGGSNCVRMDVDASNSAVYFYQVTTLVPSALYRLTVWYNNPTGKTSYLRFKDFPAHVYLNTSGVWQASNVVHFLPSTDGAWAKYEIYFNAHPSYTAYFLLFHSYLSASSSIYFDDISLERIMDPDSTGLHVYDAYNSTDRGWAATDAGFDPITIASYKIYSCLLADFYNADDVSVFTVYEGGNLDTDGVLKVGGTQVVGPRVIDARASAVANSGDATTDGLIDALRDAMIAHGLISAT